MDNELEFDGFDDEYFNMDEEFEDVEDSDVEEGDVDADDGVDDDDDYIAQGFGPDDYLKTMDLYDDEDGLCNDDGCFGGHDCFD